MRGSTCEMKHVLLKGGVGHRFAGFKNDPQVEPVLAPNRDVDRSRGGLMSAYATSVINLESVEFRLCEQSPSFVDSRIASEQRDLFSLLERLVALLSLSPGDVDQESVPETSDAAVEGFRRLVLKRLILKLKPDLASRDPELESAELSDAYERELGDGRRP